MDRSEARRLKELKRENAERKQMLAESRLKNRVLEAVREKNGKPRASQGANLNTRSWTSSPRCL